MRKLSWKPRAMWWICWSWVDERKAVSFAGRRVLGLVSSYMDYLEGDERLAPCWALEEVASSLAECECCVAHDRHSLLEILFFNSQDL
jgi:hypothetical protein